MLDEQQEAPAAEDADDATASQEPAEAGSDDATDGGEQGAEGVSAQTLAEMPDAPTEWEGGAPADAGPRQAAEERAQQAADAGAQAAAENAGAEDGPAE